MKNAYRILAVAVLAVSIPGSAVAATCTGQAAKDFLLSKGKFTGEWTNRDPRSGKKYRGEVQLTFRAKGGRLYVRMRGTDQNGTWAKPYDMPVSQAANIFSFKGTRSRMSVQLTPACTLKGKQIAPDLFPTSWNLS